MNTRSRSRLHPQQSLAIGGLLLNPCNVFVLYNRTVFEHLQAQDRFINQRRLISVSDEHALAVEIALGAAMQNIIVEDEPVAKRAIAMLKNTRSGRATFLPISTVKGNRLTDTYRTLCWNPSRLFSISCKSLDFCRYPRA